MIRLERVTKTFPDGTVAVARAVARRRAAASSRSSSAPPAAARPRPCAWSTGSIEPTRGRDPRRRPGRHGRSTRPSCAGRSATSSSRWACSRTRPCATTWRPCRSLLGLGPDADPRAGATSCSTWSGWIRPTFGDRYPAAAVRRPAAAGGRGPGARGRPAGAADGRAVRGRGPDRRATACRTSSCACSAELGKTVVFVTHDIDEAVRLGDRIAVHAAGRPPGAVRRPRPSCSPGRPTTSSPTSSAPTAP